MTEKIVFYALNQKFLDRTEDMPEDAAARQVMYYSLAIGHHIGVIDCLKAIIECPLAAYRQWIARLPEGDARRKMEGILKFGEITIDASHVRMLGAAFNPMQSVDLPPEEATWTRQIMQALQAIDAEPAMYLMVRQR